MSFTINPRGHRKYTENIAKITNKGQDLPDSVYIGKIKPYIPSPVSAKTAGDSDLQQNTVDPLHAYLSVPHLVIHGQTAPRQNASIQTAPKNIIFYSQAVSSTILNQRLLPTASNMT